MSDAPNGIAKVRFAANVPEEVTLRFQDGKLCPAAESNFPEASDQTMFTLTDGRRMYVPVFVSETMSKIGGRDFVITQCQAAGAKVRTWKVQKPGTLTVDLSPQSIATKMAAGMPPDEDPRNWGDPPPPDTELLETQRAHSCSVKKASGQSASRSTSMPTEGDDERRPCNPSRTHHPHAVAVRD